MISFFISILNNFLHIKKNENEKYTVGVFPLGE